MVGASRPAPRRAGVRARKNMDIDVAKLARARAVLGTATDTETVDQALDLVSFRHEHAAALERLAAAGGLVDAFGREAAASGRVEGDDHDQGVRRKAGSPRPAAARPRGGAAGRGRS